MIRAYWYITGTMSCNYMTCISIITDPPSSRKQVDQINFRIAEGVKMIHFKTFPLSNTQISHLSVLRWALRFLQISKGGSVTHVIYLGFWRCEFFSKQWFCVQFRTPKIHQLLNPWQYSRSVIEMILFKLWVQTATSQFFLEFWEWFSEWLLNGFSI